MLQTTTPAPGMEVAESVDAASASTDKSSLTQSAEQADPFSDDAIFV